MSQFGGSKNPPWSSLGAGSTGGHHQVMQSPLMGLSPSAAGLYNQQMAASAGNNTLAMQAQMQASAIQQAALQPQAQMMPMQQQLAGAANSQLNVSYPSSGGRQSQGGSQPKQRVFMGIVTKLHDTFGFIDEDVFFQTSTVKGSMPKVGEKVLVEATFNPNMPFKWNATRVQHLNQASSSSLAAQQMGAMNQMQQSGMLSMNMGIHNQQQGLLGNPPQAALNSLSNRRNDDRRRLERNREREDRERERLREQQERDNRDRKRDRGEHRDIDRKDRDKERDRSPVKRRSRSPRRSPKRTRKPVPRYVVQVPRFPLDIKSANVLDVKKRYPNLYIPSDYFLSDCCYQEAFPLGRPFKTSHPCTFHLMSKDVEPVTKHSAVLEPSDISYQYSAKVMLLASVSEPEFFQKCCARVEDPPELRENFQHPARILSFLVGSRGKNEVMAIGGPWSPSLDGPDPANDKSVLIRTAIRTTKALTGIDLSGCGQWFRFLEIRYHRGEQKGRPKPRVETVAIFVPDVWNIMPTRAEWETLSTSYKDLFTAKYINPPGKKDSDGAANNKQQEEDNDASMEEGDVDAEKEKVCTPWKELDPKTMKVQALRDELEGRGLNAKGLKTQLVARLAKAIKKEEEDEQAAEEEQASQEEEAAAQAAAEKLAAEATTEESEGAEEGGKTSEEETKEEEEPTEEELREMEEKRKREEKERQIQEKKYTLPGEPAIVVHPSSTAKGGKFECTVTNLSVLLDYRPEDTKEHSFEVSLFAELFNELLQRDFAFNIYQALEKAPEKKEEKKEKKKDDKKDPKKDEKTDGKTDGKSKKEEKEEDKSAEKKEEAKKDDPKKDEAKKEVSKEDGDNGDEPKEKKRKVEGAAEGEVKVEESKDDAKDKKEESKEKTESPAAAAEDVKKEEKKKDEKGTKAVSKRSSSQEAALKAKTETLDPTLLLSCVYFDQNHCGYIMDKDLEDLLNCMGLNLSRAQVRKLTHKVVSRDSWAYRKMTDGVKAESAPAAKEAVNGSAVTVEPYKGNITLLESLHKAAKPKAQESSGANEDHLVMYEGAVVDLASTMARVKRSEQQRRLAEAKIGQLQKETDKWKTVASSSQESLKALNLDVEALRKDLHESESTLRTTKRKNDEFRGCIEKAQKTTEEMSARFKAVLDRPEERKDKKSSTPVDKKPPTPVEKKEVKT